MLSKGQNGYVVLIVRPIASEYVGVSRERSAKWWSKAGPKNGASTPITINSATIIDVSDVAMPFDL